MLGRRLQLEGTAAGSGRIYTRTAVFWAVDLAVRDASPTAVRCVGFPSRTHSAVDPDALMQHVAVDEDDAGGEAAAAAPSPGKKRLAAETPIVRMITTATHRRGTLPKRMRRSQAFRSVLSMDVEWRGYMPNLKISGRNTIQVTGAQDLEVLGDILRFLCNEYAGRGIRVTGPVPGFVGDIVLANVHFRLDFRVDRARLRDCVNADRGPFIASYEPLVRDVSVSLKYADTSPLPNSGAVHPRWFLTENRWGAVTLAEAKRLVPHINLHIVSPRITSLRVFQSGSVIIVSRWPAEMGAVYCKFRDHMQRLRKRVLDAESVRQRTLTQCWKKARRSDGDGDG